MNLQQILTHVIPFVKMALILIVGHFLIVYLLKLLSKTSKKSKLDKSLIGFIHKIISIVLHILIIISALTEIGVSTAGFIAAFSAVAVGVSVALKDSLGNVAGGILLLISPRFATGDYIAAGGDEGTVVKVDMLHTTIRTIDSKLVSIPNGVLINSHIVNYSCEKKRRVDIMFSISYESDFGLAKQLAMDTIKNHPLTLDEPEEPFVRIRSYGDSSVNLLTRAWCKTEDYWNVYYDLIESIGEIFTQNGISIPYNQLDVHIIDKDK